MPARRAALLAVLLLCVWTPAAAIDPYDIYAILPLTGANSFVGNEQRQSFEILGALVNRGGGVHGRAIRFIVLDSGSNPQTAVQLTGEVLAKHPAVVIGDSALSTCAAMAPLLANGPLHFCLSPGFIPARGSNAYSIGTLPVQQAAAALRYAQGRGWTKLAMLLQNDATGDSAQRSFTTELAQPEFHAMQLVTTERFSPGDISVAAQLARIRAAGAQFIVSYNSGAPFGIVVHGMHDAGLDLPVFTSQGNLSYVELKQYADNLPRQLYFISGPLPPDGPAIPNGPLKATDVAFLDAFRQQGLRPDWGNAAAWDTGAIIIAALRARGLDATPEQLKTYINSLHGLPTVQGLADFTNGEGRGVYDARILAWDKSRNTWTIVSGPGGTPKT
ncbi:MAG TPA: ABC transporter substrate-binding protein [Candidatus Lustribacter sp.]|jgi:branched-chain amino acid transport system substrate-binding protein|nr:ABC transporter substrate-binding protein [Candidatus Lustribacter sp.]